MLKDLFQQLFAKLGTEKNLNNPSKNGKAIFFIEEILDKRYHNFGLISDRTLREYYDKYVEGKKNKSGEPKTELKNCISKYLGYKDFEEFVLRNKKPNVKRKYLLMYSGVAIIFLLIGSYFILSNSITHKDKCLVWVQDHYETINCNGEKPNELIKNVNVAHFKKVKLNKESTIFKNGHPMYWYGKSVNGNIEFFNDRGVHPITFKELKPVTKYIFEKYVIKQE